MSEDLSRFRESNRQNGFYGGGANERDADIFRGLVDSICDR